MPVLYSWDRPAREGACLHEYGIQKEHADHDGSTVLCNALKKMECFFTHE